MIALEAGMPWEEIMDAPLESLVSFCQVHDRRKSQEQVQDAWTNMVAAQGRQKDMKTHLKPLVQRAQARPKRVSTIQDLRVAGARIEKKV